MFDNIKNSCIGILFIIAIISSILIYLIVNHIGWVLLGILVLAIIFYGRYFYQKWKKREKNIVDEIIDDAEEGSLFKKLLEFYKFK